MSKKNKKVLSIIFVLFFVFTSFTITSITTKAANERSSKIHYIDLGTGVGKPKGNTTLIESQDQYGNRIFGLVDCSDYNGAYEKNIKPYLDNIQTQIRMETGNAQYQLKLNFIVVTHVDQDHVGSTTTGMVQAIDDFATSNTILFIKDITSNSNDNAVTNGVKRYNAIRDKAKSKNMPIAKIAPKTKPTASSIKNKADIENLSDDVFKAKWNVLTNQGGTYQTSQENLSEYQFGDFIITFFNGFNWDTVSYTYDAGNENVNSVTMLLKCKVGSSGKLFSTYLGSDLGENSPDQHSQYIAQRVSKLVGEVSYYQVAHHGYYDSMDTDTAKYLKFKYAIVTNSYCEIVDAYLENKNVPYNSTNLSNATNTLKNLFSSEKLQKVYFLSGFADGQSRSDRRLINLLTTDGITEMENDQVKKGNLVVTFTATNDTRQQN